MDLHVIFFNFYEGHLYHAYLNALFLSKKYGGAVITHQEYIVADLKYEDSFMDTFDMEKVTEDDKKNILQFGIPREFFNNLEKKYTSKTQAILHLYRERDEGIEEYLCNALDGCKTKVDRFYVFGESYESVRFVAKERNITIINYEFSTVRRVSDYSCNLMQAFTNGNLYSHEELLYRYKDFCNEVDKGSLLKREELIALFAPERQIKLIPLIYEEPEFEVGILNMCYGITPPYCKNVECTDDDVFTVCKKYYRQEQIAQRKHPAIMPTEGLERNLYDTDTLPFILSSKRIAAVTSNGLFEAMLWGRTACIALDAVAFYFACEHDFKSEKKVDEVFLNFYLVAGLVPSQELLFNSSYWEMRLEMSEVDLYYYHLKYIFDILKINKQILDFPYHERLAAIIKQRGSDISVLSSPKFNYDAPFYRNLCSELYVHYENKDKTLECVNYQVNGEVISSFEINETVDYVEFFPHKEKVGFLQIRKLLIDGEIVWENSGGLEFVLKQYGKKFDNISNQFIGTLQVIWKSERDFINNMNQISEQYKEISNEIENVYNSFSWKITSALRIIQREIKKMLS